MVEAILEAAAQVLEASGEAGFNTNAVAERAGVGIGSLYRYFPDKRAILVELGRREMVAVQSAMTAALRSSDAGMARDRAAIRAFLHAFGGRLQARRAALAALLAHVDPADLARSSAAFEAGFVNAQGQLLTRVQTFVLSRALLGAMRAAVVEGAEFVLAREFEDELVRLTRAYLGFAPPRSASTP